MVAVFLVARKFCQFYCANINLYVPESKFGLSFVIGNALNDNFENRKVVLKNNVR